jgi:uncharacterized protein (TIGR03437 family)
MKWICLLSSLIPALGGHFTPVVHFPVRFEPAKDGGFFARVATGASYVTASGGLRLSPQLEMRLQGAASPTSFPSGQLDGVTNDLRGRDPARWRTGIPQYRTVRFAGVWRGIDLVYHAEESRLEYDFVVAVGASPSRIVLDFRGAESVRLDAGGEMAIRAAGGEFRFHAPRILQDGKPIHGNYRLLGGNRVGFQVGRYDHARALVIDPVLGYAALFGNQGSDPVQSVAVDAAGNVYIAGTTLSEIPLVNPINAKQGAGNCSPHPSSFFVPCEDAYVAKFDPTGTKLLYSTYLGGDARDFAAGIAVDRDGNAYVAGTTQPINGPTAGGQAWVMKLNPSGSALVYNRNIGGNTTSSAIAVDQQGNAFVAGTTFALEFPGVNAIQAHVPLSTLLVTNDGGATWRSLNNNLPVLTVNSLAIDPTRPATLYAATSSGLFKSLDAGVNWTHLLSAAPSAYQVVVDPKTPATLYALYADSANGTQIAKSMDAGLTWQVLTGALPPPTLPAPVRQFGSLALDPSNPSVVWLTDVAQLSPEIYQSVDGGAHWSDVHDFPVFFIPGHGDSLSGGAILVDPANSSRVYTCCAYQLVPVIPALFRTDDAGKTWVEGGRANISTLALDPHNGAILYSSSGTSLLRSADAGQTWAAVALPSVAPADAAFRGPTIDPSGALYLLNDAGILLRSADGGVTWTVSHGPWTNSATNSEGTRILALDPVSPASTIYVGFPLSQVEHAFAAKLDPAGSILWATTIAGSQQDQALAIAVDSPGNAYVAGYTDSVDFPVVNPVQPTRGRAVGNGLDAFLTKISGDGKKLLYSTYLGGSGDDVAHAVAVDSSGNAYIAGATNFTDFPTVNAIPSAPGSTGSSFAAKFDPSGQKLLFSTYLVGTGGASTLALDGQGNAWVAGFGALGMPLVNAIQPSLGGSYLVKLTPSGNGVSLGFATYLGGFSDTITALVASPSGSIWIAGKAFSSDFLGDPAPPAGNPTSSSGFLARLDLEPLPQPSPGVPLIRAVYNAASYRLGDAVSQGEIVSLFGAELAPATQSAAGYPLPQTLQGVSVTIGGINAPLFYVSPGQINFQAPFELPLGPASIVVKRGTEASVERPVRVILFSPGIFTASSDAFSTPIIVHISDYSLVTPQNPAHAGEYLAIYCTGLGVAGTSVRSGEAAPSVPTPVQPLVEVDVDSRVTQVVYAGLAPGFAGLYQVNFQIPTDETSGTKPTSVSIQGMQSPPVALFVK